MAERQQKRHSIPKADPRGHCQQFDEGSTRSRDHESSSTWMHPSNSANVALLDGQGRSASNHGDGVPLRRSARLHLPSDEPSYHYFDGARNFKSTNSNFTFVQGDYIPEFGQYESDRKEAMARLESRCARSALLKSNERSNPPSCSENTREYALTELKAFARSAHPSKMPRLGWLRGPAGAGKTAIAQTLAETVGILVACFFFSRTGSPERADGNRLVPTLVQQIVPEYPEIIVPMVAAIKKDPFLFDTTPENQLQQLLLEPLRMAQGGVSQQANDGQACNDSTKGRALLIVIDGLDECSDEVVQVNLVKMIARAIPQLQHHFRFLIVSRPESHICKAFGSLRKGLDLFCMDLANDPHSDRDMKRYLVHKFDLIREEHPLGPLPDDWPPTGAIDQLVANATQQFIYPSTAMRFIENCEGITPEQSLEFILNLRLAKEQAERPLAALDELYTFIFKKTPAKSLTIVARFFSLYVFSPVELPTGRASTAVLERYLRLRSNQLAAILQPYLSLIQVPKTRKDNLRVYHASLFDFLKDLSRSADIGFKISVELAYETMALHKWDEMEKEIQAQKPRNLNAVTKLHDEFFAFAHKAELSDDLRRVIERYCLSPGFLYGGHPGTLLKRAADLLSLLNSREELHDNNFALHNHHVQKAVRTLQSALIERGIRREGETVAMPATQFTNRLLNFGHIIYSAIFDFCAFFWPDAPIMSHGQSENGSFQLKISDAHLIYLIGQSRMHRDLFLTPSYLSQLGCDKGLEIEQNEFAVELYRSVWEIIKSRLLELSRNHDSEANRMKEVMNQLGIEENSENTQPFPRQTRLEPPENKKRKRVEQERARHSRLVGTSDKRRSRKGA